MIVAYAGRRAQSLPGDLEQVTDRIRSLLADLQPSAVVGAAADGADLLVLEAALALAQPPTIHIVLPTSSDLFAEDSVEPAWRDRYAAVLGEVRQRGGTIRTLDRAAGRSAYKEANQAILDEASDLAVDGQRAVSLVVAAEGEGAMIEDFLHRTRLAGIRSLRIDP